MGEAEKKRKGISQITNCFINTIYKGFSTSSVIQYDYYAA